MLDSKTINQRAQEVANGFAMFIEQTANLKKAVLTDELFRNKPEYKKLLEAKEQAERNLTEYERNAVKSDKLYCKAVTATCIQAVRCFGKTYNVPSMCNETYLNSDAFNDTIMEHPQYLDTESRVASFVVKIYNEMQTRKTKVTKRTPFSISEIRLIVQMVELGFMTRSEAKEKVAKGK